MQRIINYVSDKYGLSLTDLNSKSRTANINECRQMVWLLTSELLNLSSTYIGAKCGLRDHSTVLEGVKRLNGLLDTDEDLMSKKQAYFEDLSSLILRDSELVITPDILARIELLEKRIVELERMMK